MQSQQDKNTNSLIVEDDSGTYVNQLMARARLAQAKIEFASQQEIDDLVTRLAWACVQPYLAKSTAETLVAESGMGVIEDKIRKIMVKVKGTLRDMKGKRSVGIVHDDKEKGILKIAKPMGVIAAIIPITNGEATPMVKAISAIKTRNAIIMSPPRKGIKTTTLVVNRMREVLKKQGYPEDLIIVVDKVSREGTRDLMQQADLVLATGGDKMVKAAYSSGTPSQGVGAGNAVSVVDETADLPDVANKVMRSKTFDHATSCSTENSILIQEQKYDALVKELEKVGGYLCSSEEKENLQKAMWNSETGALNGCIVAQSASKIAQLAGIDLPQGKKFLMVEETGIGKGYPFSTEKLSVTVTLYKWKDFSQAVSMVNDITTYSGAGHSCGIHTNNDDRVKELSTMVKVSRVMVRQPQCLANSGSWTNGMPMTMTLGCGSWGGNATTANVTWENLLNYTWVAYPIASTEPTDEELFGDLITKEESITDSNSSAEDDTPPVFDYNTRSLSGGFVIEKKRSITRLMVRLGV